MMGRSLLRRFLTSSVHRVLHGNYFVARTRVVVFDLSHSCLACTMTTKHWHDVSFHGRAFFIPATIVSLGVNRRGQSERQRRQIAEQQQQQ